MTLILSGVTYSLSHLAKIERKVEVALPGNLKKTILVEFRFSCHCYSRGPSKGEGIPPALKIADGSKEKPRDRIFDLRRYQLSFELVACIDALIADHGQVQKSRHDNFFRVDTLQETIEGVLTPITYYIFMSARKSVEPNQEKRILIYVESAYPELPSVPSPHSTREMSFAEALGKVWAPGAGGPKKKASR